MTSTFTTNKNLEKPAHNDYVDDWDIPVNNNSNILDGSLGGVSTFNVTGASSYTFIPADVQARTLKFTGTLQSGAVNYKLTNGISGDFIIDNTGTSQTDSTSALTLSWTSGGTSLVVPQGTILHVYADGGGLVWKSAAAPACQYPVTINLSSIGAGAYNFLPQQLATGFVIFSGTCANGNVLFHAPSGTRGVVTFIGSFANGGGSSLLAVFATSGSGQTISTGHNYLISFNGDTDSGGVPATSIVASN